MAPEKRAEMDEKKKYGRELANRWILIAIVVLFGSSVIWWDASERAELDAKIAALIKDTNSMRVEVEEMAAKVKKNAAGCAGTLFPMTRGVHGAKSP